MNELDEFDAAQLAETLAEAKCSTKVLEHTKALLNILILLMVWLLLLCILRGWGKEEGLTLSTFWQQT